MSNPIRWAFHFQCDQSLEEICASFNANGPWQWAVGDNYIFGYYLNTRPKEGVRLRVHYFPQGFVQQPAKKGFAALLEVTDQSTWSQKDINSTFQKLLSRISARDIQATEPYD